MSADAVYGGTLLPRSEFERGQSLTADTTISPAVLEAGQWRSDEAVYAELQAMIGARLLPESGMHVLLSHDPADWGITLEQLANVEVAAFTSAGYGHRAEGLDHFKNVFRGYTSHGPLRFVIVARLGSNAPVVAVFGDYFEVWDSYSGLDRITLELNPTLVGAVNEWRNRNPGRDPAQFIASKYVADPAMRSAAAGLVGFGALALAATLRGLANANPDGIMMAARTQRASQEVIRRLLPRLVPGIEMLIDQPVPGIGAGGEQAMMLAYIPPTR